MLAMLAFFTLHIILGSLLSESAFQLYLPKVTMVVIHLTGICHIPCCYMGTLISSHKDCVPAFQR